MSRLREDANHSPIATRHSPFWQEAIAAIGMVAVFVIAMVLTLAFQS